MRSIIGDFEKCVCLVFLVVCIYVNAANSDSSPSYSSAFNFNALAFDQVKYGVFETGSNRLSTNLGVSCAIEMNAIKNGLQQTREWALKRKSQYLTVKNVFVKMQVLMQLCDFDDFFPHKHYIDFVCICVNNCQILQVFQMNYFAR